ncbi:MAG: hypothetical protein HQ539_02285 [Parcubacteria group bacterium]|nr:hypothetical protein [Parcubacteria group bacterium]
MINLLPPQEKQGLKSIEAQKKIIVIFTYFLFCLIVLISFLFLLNFYVNLKIDESKGIIFMKTEELERYKFNDFKEATIKVNQHLSMIQMFQEQDLSIGPLLQEITDITSQGVSFNSISLRNSSRLIDNEETEQVEKQIFSDFHLIGTAETRDILYAFKKILENQTNFEQVYFAPNSWTKSSDAVFSVTFEVIR